MEHPKFGHHDLNHAGLEDLKEHLKKIPRFEVVKEFATRYPDVDPGSVEAFLMLLKTSIGLLHMVETRIAGYGLSRGRFAIMMQLVHVGDNGLNPSELADRCIVTRATITGLIDGLEKDGLVERRTDSSDRRSIKIWMTSKGKELMEKILPPHFRSIAGLMSSLSDSEKKELIKLLEKVVDNFGSFVEQK
jgi:DNA-binding MarR family transcriptional regulator